MSGSYSLYSSILEKCGNFWKNGHFSRRIWPDWGNTARADMAGLGSIGLSLAQNGACITLLHIIFVTDILHPILLAHPLSILARDLILGRRCTPH